MKYSLDDLDRILFFDTETTGIPPKGADYKQDCEYFPHVVSISWAFFYGIVKHYIIKPEFYDTMPEEAEKVHGISYEQAMKEGRPFLEVIDEFLHDCQQATHLVGHSIYFDISIIKAGIFRRGLNYIGDTLVYNALDKHKRIDTMMKTIKYVGATHKDGRKGKFPTLSELYTKCTNGSTFPAHNAAEDVKALITCFETLLRDEVIEI